jgi:uncharacterized protein YeeX (DUF496 family)
MEDLLKVIIQWAIGLGIGALILEVFIILGQKFWGLINSKIEKTETKWDDFARDTVIDALVNAEEYIKPGQAKEMLRKFITEVIKHDYPTDKVLIEKAQAKLDELEKK